jgi:hypothetical protein
VEEDITETLKNLGIISVETGTDKLEDLETIIAEINNQGENMEKILEKRNGW